MKLLVKLLLLLICVGALLRGVCSDVSSNLSIHLVEVLFDVSISLFKLFLGELSDLSLHHSLFISEEAIRSTEEAFESNNFLKETELGIGLLINSSVGLGFLLLLDGLLDGGVDLGVDLGIGE